MSKAPLKYIGINAPDLEPLCGLPLEGVELNSDYKPEQIKRPLRIPTLKQHILFGSYTPEQLEEFRGNPILKTINDKPAAEFWKAGDRAIPDKKEKANGD